MSWEINHDFLVLPVRIALAGMENKNENFPATILKGRLTYPEEKLKKYSEKNSDGFSGEAIGKG